MGKQAKKETVHVHKHDVNASDRFFLNKKHGTSCIQWFIKAKKDTTYTDMGFELSDCSRRIYLDFDFYSDKGRKKKLEKLDRIIESMQRFRDNLSKVKMVEKDREEWFK